MLVALVLWCWCFWPQGFLLNGWHHDPCTWPLLFFFSVSQAWCGLSSDILSDSMSRFDVDHVTEWYDVTITSLVLHIYTRHTHLCTHCKTHCSTLLYTLQYHMISLSDISRQTRSCVALCLSYCNWLWRMTGAVVYFDTWQQVCSKHVSSLSAGSGVADYLQREAFVTSVPGIKFATNMVQGQAVTNLEVSKLTNSSPQTALPPAAPKLCTFLEGENPLVTRREIKYTVQLSLLERNPFPPPSLTPVFLCSQQWSVQSTAGRVGEMLRYTGMEPALSRTLLLFSCGRHDCSSDEPASRFLLVVLVPRVNWVQIPSHDTAASSPKSIHYYAASSLVQVLTDIYIYNIYISVCACEKRERD